MPHPISDAAAQHIMPFPSLVLWSMRSGPPEKFDLSQFDAFPDLKLCTETSLRWFPPLGAALRCIPPGQTSYDRGPIPKLIPLDCLVPTPANFAFMSPIMLFYGLEELILESPGSIVGECAFSLMDDDVAKAPRCPTWSMPHLDACAAPTHARPPSSPSSSRLFAARNCGASKSISMWGIFRDDLEWISENPRLRDLCVLSRCQIGSWGVSKAPLRSTEEDYERLAAEFPFIFPGLRRIGGMSWNKLSSRLHNRE